MPDEITTNQEPITSEPVSVEPTDSEPNTTPSEPLEAPKDVSTPEVVNNTTLQNMENKGEMAENTLENTKPEELPAESTQAGKPPVESAPENQTAQTLVNEPLNSQNKPLETKTIPAEVIVPVIVVASKNKVFELLNKAKLATQSRKRKKLDKVMTLFLKKSKITNDEVEKFLHVSDATAERYLNILEKENKIKQVGKTGKAVTYSKI